MFHIAKHAMKYIAFKHEFDISNLPIDSSGNVVNDLILNIEEECSQIKESHLEDIVLYFAPNVNSIRRIRVSYYTLLIIRYYIEKEERVDIQINS